MREIFFRGKRVDKGVWIYGFYVEQYGSREIYLSNGVDSEHGFDHYHVIPETVGQYTGLTDKNGKKIFEGDIIKVGINQRLMDVRWNEETLAWELTNIGVAECEVNHLLNTFSLAEIQVEAAYGKMVSEVIGNIHDNPELLNENGGRKQCRIIPFQSVTSYML